MRLYAVILCAAVVLPSAAKTQEKVDCSNPVTQFDMNECAGQDYSAADDELNKVWKEARAEAKKQDAEAADDRSADAALLASQRGWIAYRDGQCELARYDARGGTMEPMLEASCLASMTRARTKELRDFATGVNR